MNPSEIDEKYFLDYEDLEIHELMLKDRPRQEAYYKSILNNHELFKDKIVMDVGAGTGILSAFCAKAGAKRVYAVEASNLAKLALNVIDENNLSEVVKVIQSKVEDFQLPAGEKVDIIVSEWMGFYLLHEGMLDSVIFARNKFLKDGGLMFPTTATLYVSPCSVPSRYEYWDNIDGIKMRSFGQMLRSIKSHKPEVTQIDADCLLHEGTVVSWFNLETVTLEELDNINLQEVVATQKGGHHQGFCLWFDCGFPSSSGNFEDMTVFSTSPKAPETHWKQCVIVLPENACEQVEENTPIAFKLSMQRNPNDPRKYNLEMELLDSNDVEHPMPCNCFMTKCILTKAHLATMETDDD